MSDSSRTQGKVRAAVIGLGAMGKHHVRVYSELPTVDLVAVADVDPYSVERTISGRTLNGYTDIGHMLEVEKPDLVSIVVPTSLHASVAYEAMHRGIHCLVEKPIAGTLEEAWTMIAVAADQHVNLMIGHIERFNPAVIELKNRVGQLGEIFQISARRVGPFPDRIRDVGVTIDLATHDIDAMRFILGDRARSVFARTAQRIHATHEDLILGTIEFERGAIGSLDVNWLTPTKIRELTVVGSHGTFVANYLTQDLAFFENAFASSEWDDLPSLQGMTEGNAVRYAFRKEEPLRAELAAFVNSVLAGETSPAPPEDAAEALATALDLLESSRTAEPATCRRQLRGVIA
jgi:UDP-N-acetylglucosamine 3-dehydrogenase